MAGGSFQVVGAVELGKQLEQFTDKLRKNIITKAERRAMQQVYNDALRAIPKDTGTLASALAMTTKTNKETGTVVTSVGIKPGKATSPKKKKGRLAEYPEVYGPWVEYGHYAGKRNRMVENVIARLRYKGRRRGGIALATITNSALLRKQLGDTRVFVVANPFLRPAWDKNYERVKRQMQDEIKRGIELQAAKAARASKSAAANT